MKTRIKTVCTGLVLAVMFLAGCGLAADNKQAREIATKFYDALKAGDLVAAASYCGTDATMNAAAWQEIFAQNQNTMGRVTAYESAGGFNVSQSGGKSTVIITYDVNYEYGKSADSLIMINLGEGFLVYEYKPVIVEARFQEEMAKSKSLVMSYLQALQSGDHAKALGFVGYSGASMHPAEEWDAFYMLMNAEAGRIGNIQILDDACLAYLNDVHSEAGTGNIYSIKVNTTNDRMMVSHQVDVYQPEFGQDLKIIAHNIE
jgi:hypothetical protein